MIFLDDYTNIFVYAVWEQNFSMQVFKKLETALRMSSTDHPHSDGQIKQVNWIIEDMLRAYVGAKPTKWERYLPILEFSYKSSKHMSTGYSRSMLMYGFHPRAPIDVNIHHDELWSTQNFLRDMQDMLHIARDNIKTCMLHIAKYSTWWWVV